MIRHGTKSEKP